MPDRAGSKSPEAVVPQPGLSMSDRIPEQNDVAERQARPELIRALFLEHDRGTPRRFGYGDLIEGGVAVTALLVMLRIGVTPWLAIPLSVLTYIGVTLLWPVPDHEEEMVGTPVEEQPCIEETEEHRGPIQFPDERPIGVEAVAARFGLTRREQEILPLLAQRLTDREIAERLSISHRTAMNHTANILGKLGLTSRRDVSALIALHDFLTLSAPHEETK